MIIIRSLGRVASYIRYPTVSPGAVSAARSILAKQIVTTSTTPAPAPASNHQQDQRQQQNLIDIKDSCLNRLRQILDKPQEEFLRIQVETGGCSGFSYMFDIENNQKLDPNDDLIFERDQYRIVINKDILPYMKGSSIEFTESLIKSSFQIVNPVAETKCSCGSSFSIDLSKLQKPS